ncbi:MAG TPA: glycosyltransferase [Vicinamibacterales bacterium]|nr:glycosyltransferase [Vicinamibacterales bacterium]
MRVLHVTPYFAPAFAYGGPPRSVLGLCHGLRHAGVDVRVVTTTAAGGSRLPASGPGFMPYEGIPVHYAPLARPSWYFNAAIASALDEGLAWCDVCHVHGLWNVPEWIAVRHAARARVPYVISPRGMLEPEAMVRGRLRKRVAWHLIERRGLQRAALLHATSERESATLRALDLGVEVAVVPNGVDADSAALAVPGTFRRYAGLSGQDPLIVFLGRLHPIKRLDLLADAFLRLRASRPDARLIIAGRDEGGYRRTIEPRLAAAGAAVRWMGEVDTAGKWDLLADAAVLVCCSDSESFGMSVAEAMAAGVPVVVTDTCPWPQVETWGCGRWVAQTPAALAGAVLDVLAHPDAAREMGARGQALARRCFAWDAVAVELAARYAGVAARGTGAGRRRAS